MTSKFNLGQLVATPAALDTLARHNKSSFEFIRRHQAGDWGDTYPEDAAMNDAAFTPGMENRVMSVYKLDAKDTIWIITEWDRSVTTVLLPADY